MSNSWVSKSIQMFFAPLFIFAHHYCQTFVISVVSYFKTPQFHWYNKLFVWHWNRCYLVFLQDPTKQPGVKPGNRVETIIKVFPKKSHRAELFSDLNITHRMPLYFIPVSVSLRLARTLIKRLLSKNLNFKTQFTHAYSLKSHIVERVAVFGLGLLCKKI